MNIKNGLKNISYSMIGQVITLVIGVFIPRLVIVSYGSEYNGLLSSTSTIISYLALLEAGVGATTSQALYKPINEKNRQSINEILSATHYYYKRTGLTYFVLVFLISLIYPLVIKSSINYWIMVAVIFINGIPGIISFLFQRKYISFLQAIGENYVVTNLQTVINVVASLMKAVLLYYNTNIVVVQLIYCLTSLGQMIFISIYIRKKYIWISVKENPNRDALKQKNAALIHQICSLVTYSTDVMILSVFCDLKTVSIYSVYNMIFAIVYNAVTSINSSLQYALGQAYCKGRDYYIKVIDTYETIYITLSSSLMLTTYVLIIPFLKLYTAGADINYINIYFPILFVLVKLFDSFRNATINTITVSGNFKTTQSHAIIESIINLTVSMISVWKFGMIGVLFGTIIAFVYRDIISIRFVNKNILFRSSFHSVRATIINLILVILGMIISKKINLQCENYLMFFLSAVIITIVLLMVFCIANFVFDKKSFFMIKNIISNRILSKIKNK